MRAFFWTSTLCTVRALAAPSLLALERDLAVSQDGYCGASNDTTCVGSFLGDCCSEAGVCGNTVVYCGQGCQSEYGNCTGTVNGLAISNDGSCGNGVTCQDSIWGDCCSANGFCGSTSDYCGVDCNTGFGLCGSTFTSSTESSVYLNSTSTTSVLSQTTTNPTCPRSNGTIYVAASFNQYEVDCGFDRPGNDIKVVQVYSNTIFACILACETTTGCVDVVMSGTACYLKSTIAKPVKSIGLRGARLFKLGSQPSSSVSAPSSPIFSFSLTPASGTASSTRSIVSSESSTSSAPTATFINPTCPKSNATEFVATSGAIYLIECYMDRTGNDLSSVQIYSNRIADCINKCDSTTGCVDISMSGTACYLKSKSNPVISRDTQVRGARLIKAAPSSSTSSSIVPSSENSLTYSTTLSASVISTITSSSEPIRSPTSSSASVNSTSLISTSVSLTTVPLTTAPLTTGVSSAVTSTSLSTGVYTNSTTAANSTTVISTTSYAFTAGGIPSGVLLATNTTVCSIRPTSTSTCVPCEGQGDGAYCGFTAETNSYDNTPITCNTVTVNLEVTECTVSPDGYERSALCVNGQTPGPLIEANWGDTIVAHVTNSMSLNGTSIHWHGMRQLNTSEMDGVVSVTQCPLAPGQSQTYTFTASNYGFSWYHSHLTLQAYEGVFGPMWIHGPQTQDADGNAGSLIVTDWSHIPVDDMYYEAEINGVRTMDTGLINGMNVYGEDGSSDQTGERYTVPTEFVPGQTYMFNILNAAIQSTYKFYIDGHNMTVISNDYVPIVPYETDVLNINIGQRYQVIVTANQDVGDYWLRFDNQNACASTTYSDNIKGIIHYSGSAGVTPTSAAHNYTRKYATDGVTMLGTCEDEPLASLVPAAPMDVGAESFEVEHSLVVSSSNPLNLYRWYLDGTTFQANWDNPTLYSVVNNNSIPDYSGNLAIELPNLGEWVYLIIESAVPLGHPIHLHGHDFHILAAGYGTYDDSVQLNLKNPPRRDVAFMPGDGPTGQGGYLVIAFFTDNPGVFLAHCHIGWHVSMGFALQFIEAKDQITVSDTCLLNDVCDNWRDWADSHGIHTDDSGV